MIQDIGCVISGSLGLCLCLGPQKAPCSASWEEATGVRVCSLRGLFSLQTSPIPGSQWVLAEGENQKHSRKQNESAQSEKLIIKLKDQNIFE